MLLLVFLGLASCGIQGTPISPENVPPEAAAPSADKAPSGTDSLEKMDLNDTGSDGSGTGEEPSPVPAGPSGPTNRDPGDGH